MILSLWGGESEEGATPAARSEGRMAAAASRGKRTGDFWATGNHSGREGQGAGEELGTSVRASLSKLF